MKSKENGLENVFGFNGPDRISEGLEKREYMATHILTGLLSANKNIEPTQVTEMAVLFADHLLMALADE